MRDRKITARLATALLGCSLAFNPAVAAEHQMPMHKSRQGHGPADKAFAAAMGTMHKAMMIDYSGDADVDFVRGMIPHHQGAIDMAKVELKYGKDPELRKLAQDIVAAQEHEVARMKAWLKAHGR